MMSLRKSLVTSVGVSLLLAAVSAAQQPQGPPATRDPDRAARAERMGRGHRGEHRRAHRPGLFRLEGELALSEAQKVQLRAIHQKQFESNKSLREEFFTLGEKRRAGTLTEADRARAKTLRQEMKVSIEGVEAEAENILTPAQRAKVQEMKLEHNRRREERMERRREFQKNDQ